MITFHTLTAEIEVPRPNNNDGFYDPTIEIEFGCAPGPRSAAGEVPLLPDLWVRGARVLDGGGMHLTSEDAEVLAIEYLDSMHGTEHAAFVSGDLV